MLRVALLGSSLIALGASSLAQSPAPPSAAAPSARLIGTVISVTDSAVTVHPEAAGSADVTVAVTPQTRLLRSAPGETSLKTAQPLDLHDLAPGDRVLIRPAGDGDASHPTAALLVAMKQADISQAHQQEASDWQRRGITGIVDTVDASSGTIRLKAQGAAPAITVHTSGSTVVRHYAPASTAFADTHKAALADIHSGDQLRARGQKNEAGDQLAADEIVVGSFRNIAGTVLASDGAANTLSLTDLATKRPVTLQLEAGTQLRRLPPEAAARLARRAGAGSGANSGANAGAAVAAPVPTLADASGRTPGPARSQGGDAAALLSRAPSITAADLHKGDAVMVVASGPEAKQPVAITVIAGVEPLLQASPEASAGLFSASWNLGGGAGGEEGAPH